MKEISELAKLMGLSDLVIARIIDPGIIRADHYLEFSAHDGLVQRQVTIPYWSYNSDICFQCLRARVLCALDWTYYCVRYEGTQYTDIMLASTDKDFVTVEHQLKEICFYGMDNAHRFMGWASSEEQFPDPSQPIVAYPLKVF
jgi:hypothetical protein